jgi:hypothetical protein
MGTERQNSPFRIWMNHEEAKRLRVGREKSSVIRPVVPENISPASSGVHNVGEVVKPYAGELDIGGEWQDLRDKDTTTIPSNPTSTEQSEAVREDLTIDYYTKERRPALLKTLIEEKKFTKTEADKKLTQTLDKVFKEAVWQKLVDVGQLDKVVVRFEATLTDAKPLERITKTNWLKEEAKQKPWTNRFEDLLTRPAVTNVATGEVMKEASIEEIVELGEALERNFDYQYKAFLGEEKWLNTPLPTVPDFVIASLHPELTTLASEIRRDFGKIKPWVTTQQELRSRAESGDTDALRLHTMKYVQDCEFLIAKIAQFNIEVDEARDSFDLNLKDKYEHISATYEDERVEILTTMPSDHPQRAFVEQELKADIDTLKQLIATTSQSLSGNADRIVMQREKIATALRYFKSEEKLLADKAFVEERLARAESMATDFKLTPDAQAVFKENVKALRERLHKVLPSADGEHFTSRIASAIDEVENESFHIRTDLVHNIELYLGTALKADLLVSTPAMRSETPVIPPDDMPGVPPKVMPRRVVREGERGLGRPPLPINPTLPSGVETPTNTEVIKNITKRLINNPGIRTALVVALLSLLPRGEHEKTPIVSEPTTASAPNNNSLAVPSFIKGYTVPGDMSSGPTIDTTPTVGDIAADASTVGYDNKPSVGLSSLSPLPTESLPSIQKEIPPYEHEVLPSPIRAFDTPLVLSSDHLPTATEAVSGITFSPEVPPAHIDSEASLGDVPAEEVVLPHIDTSPTTEKIFVQQGDVSFERDIWVKNATRLLHDEFPKLSVGMNTYLVHKQFSEFLSSKKMQQEVGLTNPNVMHEGDELNLNVLYDGLRQEAEAIDTKLSRRDTIELQPGDTVTAGASRAFRDELSALPPLSRTAAISSVLDTIDPTLLGLQNIDTVREFNGIDSIIDFGPLRPLIEAKIQSVLQMQQPEAEVTPAPITSAAETTPTVTDIPSMTTQEQLPQKLAVEDLKQRIDATIATYEGGETTLLNDAIVSFYDKHPGLQDESQGGRRLVDILHEYTIADFNRLALLKERDLVKEIRNYGVSPDRFNALYQLVRDARKVYNITASTELPMEYAMLLSSLSAAEKETS